MCNHTQRDTFHPVSPAAEHTSSQCVGERRAARAQLSGTHKSLNDPLQLQQRKATHNHTHAHCALQSASSDSPIMFHHSLKNDSSTTE